MNDPIIAFKSHTTAKPCPDFPGRMPTGSRRINGSDPANDLKEVYDRHFRVVLADTEELHEQSFRMRYQVYCIENEFEPPEQNPGQRETDEYDDQSLHSLLIHRDNEAVVGTVRLILPEPHGHAVPLPIRRLCSAETLSTFSHRLPINSAAEISRFAITRQFRRPAVELNTITGEVTRNAPSDQARLIPHISLGLMQAVLAMAIEAGVTHLFAVMEPTLLRMLQRLGIYFENLGPVVDYHGRRQPCFCSVDDLLATTGDQRPDVWSLVTDDGRLYPHCPTVVQPDIARLTQAQPRAALPA